MHIKVVSPKGVVFQGDVDQIVIEGNTGQMGILKNHIPTISAIDDGFIKLTLNDSEEFVKLYGAIIEFSNNNANVIAQEGAHAKTLAAANDIIDEIRKAQKRENSRKLMDFTQMEKELAQNMKVIQASKL